MNHKLRLAYVADDLALRGRQTDLAHGLFEEEATVIQRGLQAAPGNIWLLAALAVAYAHQGKTAGRSGRYRIRDDLINSGTQVPVAAYNPGRI